MQDGSVQGGSRGDFDKIFSGLQVERKPGGCFRTFVQWKGRLLSFSADWVWEIFHFPGSRATFGQGKGVVRGICTSDLSPERHTERSNAFLGGKRNLQLPSGHQWQSLHLQKSRRECLGWQGRNVFVTK